MKQSFISLTIAGSDSGGGAGVQADLKTMSAYKVFGTSVITCITAQNPEKVTGIQAIDIEIVERQLKAILDFFPVNSIKTGMLYSKEIIQAVCSNLKAKNYLLVVDPVMVATSGARLLKEDAITLLSQELIPIASVFTPNIDEANLLLGTKIAIDTMEDAAVELYRQYKSAVLLKGGHLNDGKYAKDILYDGKNMNTYSSEYVPIVNTHGTGCTYSSAIASGLAVGMPLYEAVNRAKQYLFLTLKNYYNLGKTTGLNHSPENWSLN